MRQNVGSPLKTCWCSQIGAIVYNCQCRNFLECPNLNSDMEPLKLGSWAESAKRKNGALRVLNPPCMGWAASFYGRRCLGQRILVISSIHHADSSRVAVESAAFVSWLAVLWSQKKHLFWVTTGPMRCFFACGPW